MLLFPEVPGGMRVFFGISWCSPEGCWYCPFPEASCSDGYHYLLVVSVVAIPGRLPHPPPKTHTEGRQQTKDTKHTYAHAQLP